MLHLFVSEQAILSTVTPQKVNLLMARRQHQSNTPFMIVILFSIPNLQNHVQL